MVAKLNETNIELEENKGPVVKIETEKDLKKNEFIEKAEVSTNTVDIVGYIAKTLKTDRAMMVTLLVRNQGKKDYITILINDENMFEEITEIPLWSKIRIIGKINIYFNKKTKKYNTGIIAKQLILVPNRRTYSSVKIKGSVEDIKSFGKEAGGIRVKTEETNINFVVYDWKLRHFLKSYKKGDKVSLVGSLKNDNNSTKLILLKIYKADDKIFIRKNADF